MFAHAVLRLSNTSWKDIFDEFINGTGPAHSLFMNLDESEVGPFKSFLSEKSIYGRALRDSYIEGKPKSSVTIWYDKINPVTAGLDMWEQMIGRANLSWYDLGDRFMYIIQDTKSNESLFYRLTKRNRTRHESGFGFGTTKQTYIWTERK